MHVISEECNQESLNVILQHFPTCLPETFFWYVFLVRLDPKSFIPLPI